MKEPVRPKSLPKTATWDKKESCWTAVALDAKGKKHGRAQHWYPSGTPRGETDFEKGVQHGVEHVVRGGPGEFAYESGFAEDVHEVFSTLDRGMLVRQRCLDASGNDVGSDGKPLPKRPKNVAADATWLAPLKLWVEGPMAAARPITGEQRRYDSNGRLLADLRYEKGELDGPARLFSYPQTRAYLEEAPKGPPRTVRTEAVFAAGVLESVRCFDAEDVELVSATYLVGELHGTLRWRMDLHGDLDKPILEVSHRPIYARSLLRPRPLPGTARVEADFVEGNLTEARSFDADDRLVPPPPPLAGWGEDTKPPGLAGYVASGAFARDLATYFGDRDRNKKPDPDAKRAPKVFSQLPEAQREAATAFHALVKAGTFPMLRTCEISAFGFDCVSNELYGAEDARYFGLAYDDYGDMYLLDLPTGRVRRWAHDRDPFEDDEDFESLDAFAFAVVRAELAAEGSIPSESLPALFNRLGFGWYAQE